MKKQRSYIKVNRECYNAFADEFYKREIAKSVGKHLAVIIHNALDSELKKDTYKVLEFGCGTGTILAGLENIDKFKYKLYAIDFSEKMIGYAKVNAPSAKFVIKNVLSVKNFSFEEKKKNDKFDIIIMAAFIHLFPKVDVEELFGKVKGWLNPNGLIYIDTTKEDKTDSGEISIKQGENVRAPRFRARWTEKDFENLLECNGFNIIPFPEQNRTDVNEQMWLRRIAKKR